MRVRESALFIFLSCSVASAQDAASSQTSSQPQNSSTAISVQQTSGLTDSLVTLPTGTKVLMKINHGISTKSSRVGDTVYLETTYPLVYNQRVLLPAGTFVQGKISNIKRPGRVKGRGELLLDFTTLIFPSGYTLSLDGGVDSIPGADRQTLKDEEGTIQQEGTKMKDMERIGKVAGAGAGVGAITSRTAGGALIGGGIGAAAGTVLTLFMRGDDLRLEAGSPVEMVLERPITIDMVKVKDPFAPSPADQTAQRRKLEKAPELTPSPDPR